MSQHPIGHHLHSRHYTLHHCRWLLRRGTFPPTPTSLTRLRLENETGGPRPRHTHTHAHTRAAAARFKHVMRAPTLCPPQVERVVRDALKGVYPPVSAMTTRVLTPRTRSAHFACSHPSLVAAASAAAAPMTSPHNTTTTVDAPRQGPTRRPQRRHLSTMPKMRPSR